MLDYRLTEAAEGDIEALAAYTYENFGEGALDRYLGLMDAVVRKLRNDPECPGVREMEEGMKKYHLSSCKGSARVKSGIVKNPRHLIFFRVEGGILEIVRVLHESVDFERHLE